MKNRFLERKQYLDSQRPPQAPQQPGEPANPADSPALASSSSHRRFTYSAPFSASDRALVILMENGGVDLGVGTLVDLILDGIPGTSIIPDKVKKELVKAVEKKIRETTDDLLESAELIINRYEQAKPKYYGEVVVLRNATGFYNNLRDTLVRLTKEEKIIDLFVLTHGGNDSICLTGGVSIGSKEIRDIRKVHNGNKPIRLRAVYMMNCYGKSLNQAWVDIGAVVSSGSVKINYMPEPTMYFFFNNWKSGKSFTDSVIQAYQSSLDAIEAIVVGAATLLGGPFLGPVVGLLTKYLADIENRDFAKQSKPIIQGDGSVTINSDALSFGSSILSRPFTIQPLSLERPGQTAGARMGMQMDVIPRTMTLTASDDVVDFIKAFESFQPSLYNDPAGHCTIGYGTLVHRGNCNGAASEAPYTSGVTEARATELLRDRMNTFELVVNDAVTTEMNQHQFDALVSFCYNIGSGAFRGSTLLRKLNGGDYDAVPGEMERWNKAGGKVLPGLVRRRAAEGRMFQYGDYSTS